ncbi:hypothetical protein Dimus_016671 [Dionaea muscipula]
MSIPASLSGFRPVIALVEAATSFVGAQVSLVVVPPSSAPLEVLAGNNGGLGGSHVYCSRSSSSSSSSCRIFLSRSPPLNRSQEILPHFRTKDHDKKIFEMALNGPAPARGSAAAAASLRRRRTTSSGAPGGASGNMLQFYTDDAPGLKISPNVVLVMSIGFIAFVALLHVAGTNFTTNTQPIRILKACHATPRHT